jgi:hypothetical protein
MAVGVEPGDLGGLVADPLEARGRLLGVERRQRRRGEPAGGEGGVELA